MDETDRPHPATILLSHYYLDEWFEAAEATRRTDGPLVQHLRGVDPQRAAGLAAAALPALDAAVIRRSPIEALGLLITVGARTDSWSRGSVVLCGVVGLQDLRLVRHQGDAAFYGEASQERLMGAHSLRSERDGAQRELRRRLLAGQRVPWGALRELQAPVLGPILERLGGATLLRDACARRLGSAELLGSATRAALMAICVLGGRVTGARRGHFVVTTARLGPTSFERLEVAPDGSTAVGAAS
jgi:hypothetical protein